MKIESEQFNEFLNVCVREDDREIFLKHLYKVAYELATFYHRGQKDRGGHDYMIHLQAVVDGVRDIHEKCVAILHDILEDTHLEHNELFEYLMACANTEFQQNLVAHVISDVDILTKVDGESYLEYLDRVKTSISAINVKCSDLDHNSDLNRLKTVKDKDIRRSRKYKVAKNYLASYRLLVEGGFYYVG